MWRGDGITSGILGLGLPGLTDSFMGAPSEFLRDSLARVIQYNPLVNTIGKQIQPIFALALSRDPAKSFLSFGGIPADTKVEGEWASTPIKKVSNPPSPSFSRLSAVDRANRLGFFQLKLRNGQSEYLYYQIGVDKVTWNGTASGRNKGNGTDTAPPDYIVDSGTTLNLMPYGTLFSHRFPAPPNLRGWSSRIETGFANRSPQRWPKRSTRPSIRRPSATVAASTWCGATPRRPRWACRSAARCSGPTRPA